jgi:hypothetical protein
MIASRSFRRLASAVVLPFAFAACSPSETSSEFGPGPAGSPDASDAPAQAADAGADQDASTGSEVLLPDVLGDGGGKETAVVEGGYDAALDANVETSCSDAPPPPAKIVTGACTPATDNECDGAHDPPNMQGNKIENGLYGNGFDDDCDGLVDEGCRCDVGHPVGTTKDCYLMPSSWVDDATKLPVGWCAENSRGTVKCVSKGGNPEDPIRGWDGECRGARPPFSTDTCAPGDFNCDGVPMNPAGKDCACVFEPVQCPVGPLTVSPFPDRADLTKKDPLNPLVDATKPFIVDGYDWIDDTVEAQSKGWTWELTGGDCDDVLPHPTFAMYQGQNALLSAQLGTQANNLGTSGHKHGFVTAPNDSLHRVYPAFSLSGDYVARAKFKLDGKDYECSVKIQVRAPGIRAELCWDTVGDDGGNDVDLHFARLQGNTSCPTEHGWFTTCGAAPDADDCYYNTDSGCPSDAPGGPGWGYASSHDKACHGWGSLREATAACTNPRLDRDNISCNVSETDPNAPGDDSFCGPENINLDNPKPGDRFIVGVQCYDCVTTVHPAAHPHVNVYCDGARKFSAGYDPGQPPPNFPALVTAGQDEGGSLWSAVVVAWKGAPQDPCKIQPVPSKKPNATTDGSTLYCVEDGPQNKGGTDPWHFVAGGGLPSSSEVCWH